MSVIIYTTIIWG